MDIVYAPVRGDLVILTDLYADYDSRTQKAVYSEDRSCPEALKLIFQSNGRVILHEAAALSFDNVGEIPWGLTEIFTPAPLSQEAFNRGSRSSTFLSDHCICQGIRGIHSNRNIHR